MRRTVPGGGHENADEPVGKQKDEQRPHRAEKGGGHQRVLQRRADASPFARAEAGRKDGLGGLAHAVCTALDHGAHVHDHTVHGQCVRAQSLQDLAVEQHGQDAHGDVEKERGKAGGQNLPQLGSGHFGSRTGRSVQRREKKWDSITVKVMPEPMAVASPAPNTPMSQVNTKK